MSKIEDLERSMGVLRGSLRAAEAAFYRDIMDRFTFHDSSLADIVRVGLLAKDNRECNELFSRELNSRLRIEVPTKTKFGYPNPDGPTKMMGLSISSPFLKIEEAYSTYSIKVDCEAVNTTNGCWADIRLYLLPDKRICSVGNGYCIMGIPRHDNPPILFRK